MPIYRIGCSGFLYDSWKGAFYPEDLPHKNWLTFYMGKFNAVELNVTFYRLLKKEAFERWYKETYADFSFCLKGSRFITHVKKLKDVELPLSTFFNATAPLLEKLDVILWQLPPNLKLNIKNLEDFIENLKQYPYRHAFEFRHKSWLSKKVLKLLSEANMAICMADWPAFIEDLPSTADFIYIRRHGEGGGYSTNYTTEQLKNDAKRIKEYLKAGKDVYYFLNNDAFAYAPKNAIELKAILENILPKSLSHPEQLEAKQKKAITLKKKTVRIIPKPKLPEKPSADDETEKKPAAKKGKKAISKAVTKPAIKTALKKSSESERKSVKAPHEKTAKKPAKKPSSKK